MAIQARQRAIDDAGEKIGGARKDFRRDAMTVVDLDVMTAAEQASQVRKDNIWPPPDYAALVAGGMAPAAAALVKIIRDGMAARPRALPGVDPLKSARDYVAMVGTVRDACLSCTTVDDARGVQQAVHDRLGWAVAQAAARGRDPAAVTAMNAIRNMMFSIYKGRSSPLAVGFDEIRRASVMVAGGFAADVPTWRKGVRSVEFGGNWILLRGKQRVGSVFPSEEDAWEWLHAEAVAAASAKADGPPEPREPERPHLDHIVRNGPDYRRGADVAPEDFIREFGFRGVEFGNWLPDGERQQVLNFAYDSFHDLADLAGVPPSAISLGGTLAVAFGARGSGRFAAHYEPGRRVVNVTRLRGAGSSAHEWFHALDHYLGVIGGRSLIENGDACYASGNRTHTRSRMDALCTLPAEAAGAIDVLMNAFRTSPRTLDEAIAVQQQACADARDKVSKAKDYRARHLAAVAAGSQKEDRKWLAANAAFTAHWEAAQPAMEARLARLRAGDPREKTGERESSYLQQAKSLSGASGEYWTRPTEMFARAGEAAVFDMLAGHGVRSDFLVQGVEEDRFGPPMFRGNPYPAGDERIRYRALFRALFDSIRPVIAPDATPQPGAQPDAEAVMAPALR